jgi:hypothetical protein
MKRVARYVLLNGECDARGPSPWIPPIPPVLPPYVERSVKHLLHSECQQVLAGYSAGVVGFSSGSWRSGIFAREYVVGCLKMFRSFDFHQLKVALVSVDVDNQITNLIRGSYGGAFVDVSSVEALSQDLSLEYDWRNILIPPDQVLIANFTLTVPCENGMMQKSRLSILDLPLYYSVWF